MNSIRLEDLYQSSHFLSLFLAQDEVEGSETQLLNQLLSIGAAKVNRDFPHRDDDGTNTSLEVNDATKILGEKNNMSGSPSTPNSARVGSFPNYPPLRHPFVPPRP